MLTRKTLFISAILILCLLIKPSNLNAQTDLSEGWEINATARQSPDKVMKAIGVKPGMHIGEIGAGRGRYTVYLAREVGPDGKIFANDIKDEGLRYIETRCKKLGLNNVETILGKKDDPLFSDNSLDMAIMVWVYHMIDKPDELLKNLRSSLKPGALLVILDPMDDEIDAEFNIDRCTLGGVPTIKERVEKSARVCGFELLRTETFLPQDYIFILKATD